MKVCKDCKYYVEKPEETEKIDSRLYGDSHYCNYWQNTEALLSKITGEKGKYPELFACEFMRGKFMYGTWHKDDDFEGPKPCGPDATFFKKRQTKNPKEG